MRPAFIGLVAVVALSAASTSPGAAQESFFNERYCTIGGSEWGGGIPDCAYHTWEQCVASARGLGRYCSENWNWKAKAASRDERTPRRKHIRR